MMTTGGGLAASRKTLAASSRPSTSLLWPASSILEDTPVVMTGGLELTVGLVQLEGGGDTVEDQIGTRAGAGAGANVVMATGAEMLAKTPAKDESMLYSTSILENLAGRGPKKDW